MNPSFLIVEDDDVLLKTLSEVFSKKGFRVLSADNGSMASEFVKSQKIDLALLDLKLPDTNGLTVLKGLRALDENITVLVMTAYPEVKTAVSAMKEGAYDYINKPFELDELKMIVDRALEVRKLRSEVEYFRHRKDSESPEEMIGVNLKTREVKRLIELVARTPKTTVLITGETGTGKELVATAIHRMSERRDKPFIKVNCGAIPNNLLESELFGYEKGAFTDAKHTKKGLFELSDGGTIFLDEIGDMEIGLQPKVLHVLENQTFRQVGGHRNIKVDVRIVAATNRDLGMMVGEGKFRQDLYYRLKVMVINLPPLREKGEDIILLAEHFIGVYNKNLGKAVRGLSKRCGDILLKYLWPGNVRELRNIIERAVILANSGEIQPEHLPKELLDEAVRQTDPRSFCERDETLEEIERCHILHMMQQVNGNKSLAAKKLGISRLTLREKLKRYRIENN